MPAVGLRHLLRQREIGPQAFEHRRRRETADRIFGRAVEELPAIDDAMHITVEQLQDVRRIVARFPALHGDAPMGN